MENSNNFGCFYLEYLHLFNHFQWLGRHKLTFKKNLKICVSKNFSIYYLSVAPVSLTPSVLSELFKVGFT